MTSRNPRRREGPSLHDVYGPTGAPRPGEKGFRAPPERPPGALDGQPPAQLAARLLDRATTLLDAPDLPALLDPEWVAEWRGWEPAEEEQEHWDSEALPEALGLPRRDSHGRAVDPSARSDYAHRVLEIAMTLRQRAPPGERLPSSYLRGPWLPRWAALAILEDELTGRVRNRLVNVPKDEAFAFVKRHHSKLGGTFKLPPGTMYALGILRGDRLVAVALAGHPTAAWDAKLETRRTDARNIVELTRIASDGTTRNASSMLAARIIDVLAKSKRGDPDAPALFVTYSLSGEAGTTYKALRDKGLRPVAVTGGKAPSGTRRKGVGARSEEMKIRWEAGPIALPGRWELLEEREPPGGDVLPFLLWRGYTGGYRAVSPWGGAYVIVRGKGRWTAYHEGAGGKREFLGRESTYAGAKGLVADRATHSNPF